MGNRVAEIREGGCREISGWIVFQSTSQACFTPIFGDQLSAEIFAAALHDIYPNWTDQHQARLQGRVIAFMNITFGEDPEEHAEYLDFLCSSDRQAELLHAFRNYSIEILTKR